ncbi:hypothetical protein EBS43_12885 [bacterium]|nr:hypothetical protein [bacterium]
MHLDLKCGEVRRCTVFCPRKYHYEALSKKERIILTSNRWIVERSISWIKTLRRVKVCYEKSLETYLSFLDLACLMISFRKEYQ